MGMGMFFKQMAMGPQHLIKDYAQKGIHVVCKTLQSISHYVL